MEAYLGSIWKCRRFWISLVLNDVQLRYRRSVLGVGWSMLLPLCTSLVLGLVFHEIFKVPIEEFLPFLFSGLSCWAYITGVILDGCQSYVQAEPYIRQHPLPLAIYPLRTTLGALVHFLIALLIVFILTQVLVGPPNLWALPALVPGILLLFLGGWSAGIVAGLINTVFRDTQHILQVCFQVMFYLTPIIYPMSMVAPTRVGWVVQYNPLVCYLDLVRLPLLEGRVPGLTCYAVVVGIDLVLFIIAVASLGYQQRRIVLYL